MLQKIRNQFTFKRSGWFQNQLQEVRVDDITTQLRRTIREIETAFKAVSNTLDLLDDKTKNLRRDCEVLLDSAGGQNESTQLLFRVAEALENPLEFLDKYLEHQKRGQQLMLTSQVSAGDLLKMQNQMVSSLEPLKFMLVFFKIEASQLSEENRQTFHSVSEEISHLHLLVDETFQNNIQNLTKARSAIITANDKSTTQFVAQSELITTKKSAISGAIKNLKQQVESNSRKTTDLDASAYKFEQAIGKLVMSLQYEDIIRQRCETIIQELHAKPDNVSPTAWLIVLATQIETAAEELRQSTQALHSGLDSICQESKEIYRAATTMDQFEHITASADGMVQMLLESIDSIKLMLTQSTQLSNDSREGILPVQNLTKELSAIVFEVSIKIQFIALNAQVRSIQVGEGSGLEVLAARTAEISAELRQLGDGTSNQIEKLHQAIEELISTIEADWNEGTTQLSNIKAQGDQLEQELHQLRDNTFESLQIVASLTEIVERSTSEDSQRLASITAQSEKLDEFASKLRAQANLDRLSPKERSKLDAEVNHFLAETNSATHKRIHIADHNSSTSFDLGINEHIENRAHSSKSLTCDNIDLF